MSLPEKFMTWWRSLLLRAQGLSRYFVVTPVLVMGAIISLTIVVTILIDRNLTIAQDQAIDKTINENELSIDTSLRSYAQIVVGGAGRVNSGPIDRTSWGQFIGTYNLKQNFPAISQVAMTHILPADTEAEYIQELSNQYGSPIELTGKNSEMTPNIIAYVTPETAVSLVNVGFDSNSEPIRLKAMSDSVDEGSVVISDRLKLIRNAKTKEQVERPAFLMYMPYYAMDLPRSTVDERRAAVRGHISAAFRAENVFNQAFQRNDFRHMSVKVYMQKKSDDMLIYEKKATESQGVAISRQQTISIYSQTFIVDYSFDKDFLVSDTQQRAPLSAAILGAFVAILIGIVTFFFLRARHHRSLLEREREVTHAKDELLSLASHQLRTPATGVKQYMGMVLQGFAGDITSTQREFLTKAYKSNERQLHVINDILHLAKLDMGRIVLAKKEFNLGEMIRDVIEEQSQDAQSAGIKVQVKLIKRSNLLADKHVLRMVVENIISNAIKYTDSGGKITVRLQKTSLGYEILVKDNGVGIEQSDIPKLFKQFSRVLNDRSHLVTGTGVGLYLARHLTRLHGGDITVESHVGKGSTFTIRLPDQRKIL